MEENVSLDVNKQKEFVKSVKGIKKLLAVKKAKSPEDQLSNVILNTEKPEKKKWIRKPKGLVYLSHIPHGFYEHQMTQYFNQFGGVTNVRVIRSPKTGNSKGYAFVEFHDPSVAQIVADTMNNYLMGKRLIKAAYIPPEKQRKAFRKLWNRQSNPTAIRRLKSKKEHNALKSTAEDLRMARNLLKTINKTKKNLKDLGIDYDFFQPVDIPVEIALKTEDVNEVIVKKEENEKIASKKKKVKKTNDDKTINAKNTKVDESVKVKKTKENENAKTKKVKDNENVKIKKTEDSENVKIKKTNDNEKVIKTNDKKEKQAQENMVTAKADKKNNKKQSRTIDLKQDGKDIKKESLKQESKVESNLKETKVIDKVQLDKQRKLKKSGVVPMEDFINVQKSDEDSDGSLDFDSDEFEKLMNDDDSVGSSDEGESSDGGDDDIIDEKVEEKINKKAVKPILIKADSQKQNKEKGNKKKQPTALKRKSEQKTSTPKKVKFEKQNKKTFNKVIKKRK